MKLSHLTSPVAAAALALASWSGTAAAESTRVVASPNTGVVASPNTDRVETIGPNRKLLGSGIWTLGLSYVPAVIVAVESDLPADDNLFIPVAGPWLDYGTRDCPDCNHETLNKVLLVTDGVFQGIGALQIVGSFLFLETRTTQASSARPTSKRTAESARPPLQIVPARLASGYGVTARGYF
jgi:hypothetical protein